MAKLTAWLATLVGVLWLLTLIIGSGWSLTSGWVSWVIGLSFLVIGIGKLTRNYGKKKR